MKKRTHWGIDLIILGAFLWISIVQSFSLAEVVNLTPPTNIKVDPGENAIAVAWDASSDEAQSTFAGYNVYFDTKSSWQLSPDHLPQAVQVKKDVHKCVVKGLENDQQYFLHVRSRQVDDGVSAASVPEEAAAPQAEGKRYTVSMFDYDQSTAANNSGYGWSRDNGQDIPGYHSVMQHVMHIDILMMELPGAKNKSVFISPSEADFTQSWPMRNKTLIADIGTQWITLDQLPETAFKTTAEIKNGHVYIIKTFDDYYVKLRIESIEEVNLLLPYGQERSNVNLNKITFIYASQLGQNYEDFLMGTP
ncbi:fibronectin type III domain-containing protein [candidate division KSB1 bacterium]|nr:fibronectin type III domain-containing protein [candidate division KSB1 bacterium]RQW00714.1 MAG: fibronectin type III domain-containing protein [candidate division KSB1 bacterium]